MFSSSVCVNDVLYLTHDGSMIRVLSHHITSQAGNPLDRSPSSYFLTSALLSFHWFFSSLSAASSALMLVGVLELYAPNRHDHRGSLKQEVTFTSPFFSSVEKCARFHLHVD